MGVTDNADSWCDVLELRDSIEAFSLDHGGLGKAVVEHAKACAEHGLRGTLLPATDSPGRGDTGRPVAVIADRVLGLKTQTRADRQVGPKPPIVLDIQAGVDDIAVTVGMVDVAVPGTALIENWSAVP